MKFSALAACLAALAAGCAATARTVPMESACGRQSKTLVLDVRPLPMPYGCLGHQSVCAAYLIGAGAVGAATTVVSGSIVLIGNTLHWVERQADCLFTESKGTPDGPAAPLRPVRE
jgi:hypothetical protein